jgi:predicted RNA binding protein YcfA (HicA-like mRNA interferase family)
LCDEHGLSFAVVKEVKQSDVEGFLESCGSTLARQKGPHNVWRSADGMRVIAIPRHGKVSLGVVRQVMKAQPGYPDRWR